MARKSLQTVRAEIVERRAEYNARCRQYERDCTVLGERRPDDDWESWLAERRRLQRELKEIQAEYERLVKDTARFNKRRDEEKERLK